jgi:hypothetical protein
MSNISVSAQHILDNCELLRKEDCKIIDSVVYERIELEHDSLFDPSEYVNSDNETYRLDNTNHIYRYFFNEYDYNYVTDAELLAKLNSEFKNR